MAATAIAAAQTSAGQAVGVMLQAGGAALLRANTKAETTAKAGDLLFAGDRLLSREAAASFIFCPEKQSETLAPASDALLTENGIRVTKGRIANRTPIATCSLPQMVRITAASMQHYGTTIVRGDSELLVAKLQSMPEAQRNAFMAEWKQAQEALLKDPSNAAAQAAAAAILDKYGIPREALDQMPVLSPTPAVKLWRELTPLVARQDASAGEIAARSPDAARSLYRELLFDAVAAVVFDSRPISTHAAATRALLAKYDPESGSLESAFEAWKKDRTRKFGDATAMDRFLDTYIAAMSAKQVSREQLQASLEAALPLGSELAAASCWLNLAVQALGDGKPDDARPLLQLARSVWQTWDYTAALASATFWAAQIDARAGKLDTAAEAYEHAAEQAAALPDGGELRANALAALGYVLRNQGRKERVPAVLTAAIEERQRLADSAADESKRTAHSEKLAALENQLGDAHLALEHYTEAAAAYRQADRLAESNFAFRRAEIEKDVSRVNTQLAQLKSSDANFEARRRLFYSFMSLDLDQMAMLSNDDTVKAEVASRRLALARQSGDANAIAAALRDTAKAYRRAGDLQAARAVAQELAQYPDRPYLRLQLLGDIASDAVDFDGALVDYREALQLARQDNNAPGRPPLELLGREQDALGAQQSIADTLLYQGNFSQSEQAYKALADAIPGLYAAGAEDREDLLRWFAEESKHRRDFGMGSDALKIHIPEITAHRKQTGFQATPAELQRLQMAELIANTLRAVVAVAQANLLGWQNDMDGAATAYESAIQQMQNVLGGAQSTASFSMALARIEEVRGNYAKADARLQAALDDYWRKHNLNAVSSALAFRSWLLVDQGRIDDALKPAQEAWQISQTGNSRWYRAGGLRVLGGVEARSKADLLSLAEQHLRAAIAEFRDMGLREQTAFALSDLGFVLERLNRGDEALASYREAVELLERLVHSLSKDVDGKIYRSRRGSREAYDRLIRLLIRRGQAGEALRYLERAKSKELVESLAGATLGSADPALRDLLVRVRERSSALRTAEAAVTAEAAKPDSPRERARIEDLRKKLAAAQAAYLETVEKVRSADPSSSALVDVEAADVRELRKRLPPKTLLLEYFPSEDGLSIFALARDREPVVYEAPAKKAELTRLVDRYRAALTPAARDSDLAESATRLYSALIAPAQQSLHDAGTLIIVPSGELNDLPFHALGRTLPDGSFRYLIDDYRVAYMAAADLLNAVAAHRPQRNATLSLVALGDPDGSLPGARQEVAALKPLFRHSDIFTGSDVTMEHLRGPASHAAFLHFATHALINRRDPGQSYLLLTGSPSRLSVEDVLAHRYGLSFNDTHLLTLSACDTNIGGEDSGTAFASLSRAFSRAGVPTVVASLWPVSDAATRDTMTAFYRELAAGRPKAEALRRAQLLVRQDPRFTGPYYWAPFVLLGEWRR